MRQKNKMSYFALMEKIGIHLKKEELGNTEVNHTGEITIIPPSKAVPEPYPHGFKEKVPPIEFDETPVVINKYRRVDQKTQTAYVRMTVDDPREIEVEIW